MNLTDPVARDINTVTDWLCINDFSVGNDIQADLIIIVGNAIMPTIMGALNFVKKSGIPLLLSGGPGISANLLSQVIQSNPYTATILRYIKTQNEAGMLYEIASKIFDIECNRIYLEDASTDCLQNAQYSRDFIIKANLDVKKIILIQDPLMQRRTFELFKFSWAEENLTCSFFNWPVFKPRISVVNNKYYIIGNQIPGCWDLDRYISLTLNEIIALRKFFSMPRFMGKTQHANNQIPGTVEEAWERLVYCTNLSPASV